MKKPFVTCTPVAGKFRQGAARFAFATLLLGTTAWSQTPAGAVFNSEDNEQSIFSEYVDLTTSGGLEYATLAGYGSSKRARVVFFSWTNFGEEPGSCWDIRFSTQSGLSTPDWSIWIRKTTSPENWILASDNVEGVLPRLRLWVKSTNGTPTSAEFVVKGAAHLTSNPDLSLQGAAWMNTRTMRGLNQSQCENVTYNTTRVVNGVVTKVR